MRIFSVVTVAALAAAAMTVLPATESAAGVLVTGSGTFGPSAPSTTVSGPDETFSFSFTLPNPIASNPTTQATNFSYDLGGSPVADGLAAVAFYPVSEDGLFDLDFTSGDIVSLYGADVGSSLTISTGVFPASVGYSDGTGDGSGTVTITAVPEPGAWALMLLGFGALGAVARSRRGLATA